MELLRDHLRQAGVAELLAREWSLPAAGRG